MTALEAARGSYCAIIWDHLVTESREIIGLNRLTCRTFPVLATFVLCSLRASATPVEPPQFQQATAQYRAGRIADAETTLKSVIVQGPGYAPAHGLLGV